MTELDKASTLLMDFAKAHHEMMKFPYVYSKDNPVKTKYNQLLNRCLELIWKGLKYERDNDDSTDC